MRVWHCLTGVVLGWGLAPGAWAQVEGLRLEGGAVALSKAGRLPLGGGAIESDAGWALRGRLRYGLGALALGAEVQGMSQKLARPPAPGAPQTLDATYAGASLSLAPLRLGVLRPYAAVGLGRLWFSDARLEGQAATASTYSLGLAFASQGRWALDLEARLLRRSRLRLGDVSVPAFKYEPKLFSAMLSYRLR